MELLVVGLNHRTAPVELRERIAFNREETAAALSEPVPGDGVTERLLLSTCNRTEYYAFCQAADCGLASFRELVGRFKNVALAGDAPTLYAYRDQEMVTHLFRVASSIDSLIVGEAQILGQVHEAFEIACRAGASGPLFHRLLETAFRVGKRVRSETEIAIGAVSVASAAATLAGRVFSEMEDRTALILGAGETGRLAAHHLREIGVGRFRVANRTRARADELADVLGGTPVDFGDLEAALREASIVVTATSAPGPILSAAQIRAAVTARRNRPVLILDLGVPRDVEIAANKVANVFLYDIDSLQALVEENLQRRRKEIPKVEAIIESEKTRFFRWYASLGVGPLIRDLREHLERIRASEVERHAGRFGEEDRERIEALSRGLVNKILHEPMVNLRSFQREGSGSVVRLETVRRLFSLERGDADEND
ncbi:MAG: glutamyl-tRNA reductase [Candidatus Eisenbacteria bacterium]|nr:glutamyl-tRNA reductase [Candidatus Latescibacterota bacterium]MBD3302912.1 glutamyl-tRNA reductase [Candidatus Eisenbacteria bacterium]